MPKNKGKGGKNFKKGKKTEGDDTRRDLIFKEDGQGKERCSTAKSHILLILFMYFSI